jgi:hypothetical protein
MVAAPSWMSPMIKSTAAPARFDDPEKPLQAYATQHGQYSNRCSQAKDRDQVSGPNGLHDLAPQFPAEERGRHSELGQSRYSDDDYGNRCSPRPASP